MKVSSQEKNKTVIQYRGQDVKLNDLARQFKVEPKRFRNWYYRYGADSAFELLEAKPAARMEMMKGFNKSRAEFVTPELPTLDPDYELKNRVASYLQLGWTKEEILIKERIAL